MYNLSLPPSFTTPPRNSTLNSKKSPTVETRHERAKKKHDEWTHDAQPPDTSSFYPSSESNRGLSNKNCFESVPDSQEETELAVSTLNNRGKTRESRAVSRLTYNDSPVKTDSVGGLKTSEISIRMLDTNIYENETRIEEIKERRHHSRRQIKALSEQVYNDDNYIRTLERTIAQFKGQKERILTREFERNVKQRR